jgi:hypothetical protein
VAGFDHSILTDVGWQALTDAEAGQHIEYTHLEAGDGYAYGGDTEMFAMTQLNSKIMDFPITNFSNDGNGQITLIGVISSQNVTTGFYFREIGVRCTIDGGPSILYAVSNSGDLADWMPPNTTSPAVIKTIQIIIKIDTATNVTVTVQAGIDLTAQNIGLATVGPGWFRDKIGQILWFKRLNSPKGTILLSETTDIVSIDTPTITQDLDMFVALGNPDIFPNFSTIQNALNYLDAFDIENSIYVYIRVSAGVWLNSGPIIVDHPQGEQIKILGTALAPKTITNAISGGGTLVTLRGPVGMFSDIAVGDYIYYNNTASPSALCVSGIWQVTAKAADSSTITYDTKWKGAAFPTMSNVPGGVVTCLKTVIDFASTTIDFFEGITVVGGGLGLLEKMVLVGHHSPTSNTTILGFRGYRATSTLNLVGAIGWIGTGPRGNSYGIMPATSGSVFCTNCACCQNESGFYAAHPGAYANIEFCFGNCNNDVGVSSNGGTFHTKSVASCGNGLDGFQVAFGGNLTVDAGWAYNNGRHGLYSLYNSSMPIGPTAPTTATGNGTRDVQIIYCSTILGNDVIYGSTNVAPNTLSWDACMFTG